MFLSGRDKQSHLFNNPSKSRETGSIKLVHDHAYINMLCNSMGPYYGFSYSLDSVKEV